MVKRGYTDGRGCVHRLTGGEESYCFLQSNRALGDAPLAHSLVFHGERESWPVRCDGRLASVCPFREAHLDETSGIGRLVPCPCCGSRHREGSTAKRLCEEWHSVKMVLKQMRDLRPSGKGFFESGTTSLPYSLDTPDLVRGLIWLRLKRAVMRRDGHSCQDCGADFGRSRRKVFDPGSRRGKGGYHWEYLEVHHIIPLNGSDRISNVLNRPENFVVLCKKCHRERHTTKTSGYGTSATE